MSRFAGKAAFITGGASGMGRGMAEAFARAGMRVVIADLREEALADTARALSTQGLAVHAVPLDVTDRARWAAAADEAEALLGPIHVLVNNAGVGLVGMIADMTWNDWDFSFGVNLGGVVNGLTTMLPRILAHGEGGHIVSTSSTAGVTAVGGAGAYTAAKFAVTGLMETLATELQGTPVGVSVFFPGPVDTNLAETTRAVRPAHLGGKQADDPLSPAGVDSSLFMTTEEVGRRVLDGMERGDLFIMTHPEFREGIVARNDALLRAMPAETINEARAALIRQFGTLAYNPVYDLQRPIGTSP